jgi:hypothetical protein
VALGAGLEGFGVEAGGAVVVEIVTARC